MTRPVPLTVLLTASMAAAATAPNPNVTPTGQITLSTDRLSPPLTSVGSALLWLSGDQTLTLTVPGTPGTRVPVTVTLTDPALDTRAYAARTPTSLDERYGAQGGSSTYTLTDASGTLIERRTYQPQAGGASGTFLHAALTPGTYTLTVTTAGQVKNTFQVSAQGAALTAERVNLTVRGQTWTTLARVQGGAAPRRMTVYDTDGPRELELRVVHPSGAVTAVPSTGDRDTQTITVPAGSGVTLLQARQPARAQQFSNTVTLAVQGDQLHLTPRQDAPAPAPRPATPAPATPITPAPVTATPTPPPAAPTTPEPAVPAPAAPVAVPTAQPTPAEPAAPALPVAPAAPVTPPAPATPEPTTPSPAPEPAEQRDSTVTLHVTTDALSQAVILSHTPPTGATFVPGSARNSRGEPVPTRRGASGTLYFTAADTPLVTYRVTHTGPLGPLAPVGVLRQVGDATDVLSGAADLADLTAALPDAPAQAAATSAGQTLLSPASGSVALYGAVTVTVSSPAGEQLPLRVNGAVIGTERIGRQERTETAILDTYVAVPLKPGPNTLQAGNDTITVTAPGAAARVQFTPLDTQADGHTPVRVQVQVTDDLGTPVPLPQVTLNVAGAQPQSPDASPSTGGYQLALRDGSGVLTLTPTTQRRVTLSALGFQEERTIELTGGAPTLLIAQGSVTVLPGSPLQVRGQGSATLEASVLGGTLRANADSRGLRAPTEARQGAYGDASAPRTDLPARGPLAVNFEHPNLSARYALRAATDPVFGVTYDTDGLSGTVRTAGDVQWNVTGYAARLPSRQVTRTFPGDGLTFDLGGPIQSGTETLTVSGVVSGVQTDRLLTRGVEYTVVDTTGVITLTRPLSVLFPDLTGTTLTVRYAGEQTNTEPVWGVSAGAAWGRYAGTGSRGARVQVGVAHTLTGTTYGVRADASAPGVDATGRVSLTGRDWRAEGQLRAAQGSQGARLAVTYQTPDYQGPNSGTPGTTVDAEASAALTPAFRIQANANVTSGGRRAVTALGIWTATPKLSLALGGGYDFQQGKPVLVGQVDYLPPYGLRLRHEQVLGGVSRTVLSGGLPLTDTLALKAEDQVLWTPDGPRQQGVIGLTGQYGSARYDVNYELPSASGEQGRVRSSVTGDFPMTDHVTVGASAAVTALPTFSATVSGDVRYRDAQTLATVGVDVTADDAGLTPSLRTTLTHSSGDWTVSESGQSVFGARSGHRYDLSAALRDAQQAWLTTASVRAGSLGPDGGEFKVLSEYTRTFGPADLRAGLGLSATLGRETLTTNSYVGGTYWMTERFGIGALYRLLTMTGAAPAHGLGIEATGVIAPGFAVTAGYNFTSYTALQWNEARRGFYIRADALLGGAARK